MKRTSVAAINKDFGMAIALEGASKAWANEGVDPSRGAFWWDGLDFKTKYSKHPKVKGGFRFAYPKHNIFSVPEKSVEVAVFWKVRNVRTGAEVNSKLRGKYRCVWISTAAHGKAIFWIHDPEYLATCWREEIQMNKIATSLALLLVSGLASAQTIYDDYEAYYRTKKGIFRAAAALRIDGTRNAVVHWQNQRIELKGAKPFPREFTVNDDIGSDAVSFESAPYACIEGQSASSSGTGVRHMSVYLLDAKGGGKVKAY
jgi:hypothetical protein